MTYETIAMYIDGEWCEASDGGGEDVVNPATGAVLARVPHATEADLDRALAAAKKGFEVWRKTAPADRAAILKQGAQLMRERADSIARTLVLEEGKPFAEARGEVVMSADTIDWLAQECQRSYGRLIPARGAGTRQLVVREPVGPVAAFTPWNFPALTPARKIGGALAAGCSIIIKASEETPGTCVAIARALADAGLPAGALNLVFGVPPKVSTHLIASPVIRKISFTGSIPVGKHLTRLAADGMKAVTMELGGHAPVIVFDDVDVGTVAKITAAGKYRNAGQVCISPTRFFVHEKVYDQFVDAFTGIAAKLTVGDGLEKGVRMGPLANPRRLEAMDAFVADAVEKGAELLTGGERIGNAGYFYRPTVLGNVPREARIMSDEPFGPLAPMTRFRDFEEVVGRANELPYGLAAYAFTGSAERMTALADSIEAGMVGINSLNVSLPETPFGGVKESGYGREGGQEGLDAYLVTKFVAMN